VKNKDIKQSILDRMQGFAVDIIERDSVNHSDIDSISKIYDINLPRGSKYIKSLNYWLTKKDKAIRYCEYGSRLQENKQNVYLIYSNSCYHYYFFSFVDYAFYFDFTLRDNKIIFNHLGYSDNNSVK